MTWTIISCLGDSFCSIDEQQKKSSFVCSCPSTPVTVVFVVFVSEGLLVDGKLRQARYWINKLVSEGEWKNLLLVFEIIPSATVKSFTRPCLIPFLFCFLRQTQINFFWVALTKCLPAIVKRINELHNFIRSRFNARPSMNFPWLILLFSSSDSLLPDSTVIWHFPTPFFH